MKRICKLLFMVLLIAASVFALASCGSDVELSLKDDAMPQLVYVKGSELSLEGGVLNVKDKDEVSTVEMTSDEVSVSGFDKDKLGEQTVTLTYKGATVTFTVTVVERMQAVDVTVDYLVGDKLDLDTGRLKITRDDGSDYTVILKSEKVALSAFDSSTVGDKTVTATYTSDGVSYTASFTATVHAIESVTLHKPNKVSYNSHDEAIDLAGGFLTLSGKGGTLTKDVALDADMISGFDLGAVNKTNTPLDQTVTVTYQGGTYTYDIKILYTSVTEFKSSVPTFAGLDYSTDVIPEVSEAQGKLAVEMMTLYLDMSPAEKSLISKSDTLLLARTAMLYGMDTWEADMAVFENAFGAEYGEFRFYCKTEKAVAQAIEDLKVEDRPILTLSGFLGDLIEYFAEEEFVGGTYFGDYTMFDPEIYVELIAIFEYLLDLDEKMDAIPENWKDAGIINYENEVSAVFDAIVNSDYYSYAYAELFYYVSSWREKDDAFDFLYEFYYEKEDVQSLVYLANIRLPSELEEIYGFVAMAMQEISNIANYMSYDATQFFYYYHEACKLSNELLDGEDVMLKTLYFSIPLNGMLGLSGDTMYTFDTIINYLCTTEGGYYHFSGALLGLDAYHELMNHYMTLIENVFNVEDYDQTAEYASSVEKLLELYFNLTPAQQLNFIGALNVFYAMNIPPFSFDPSSDFEEMTTVFVDILSEYFEGKFAGEEAKDVYSALMVATEAYAQRFTNTEWRTIFVEQLNKVKTLYDGMSEADQGVFDNYFGDLYDEYKSYTEDVTETPDLGEWADEFASLKEALLGTELAYTLIQGGYNYYGLFFSAYERVEKISQNIMTNAPDTVKEAYLRWNCYASDELDRFLDENHVSDPETTVYWCFDYLVSLYRAIYISALNTLIQGSSAYDLYMNEDLNAFLDMNYELTWALMWSQEGDTDIYNSETVQNIMAAFRALDIKAKTLFVLYIEGNDGLYYQALNEYVDEDFTAGAAAVAKQIFTLEMDYIVYENISDEESINALKTTLTEIKTAYAALEGEDKESFSVFEDDYLAYVALAEAAISEYEANVEATA